MDNDKNELKPLARFEYNFLSGRSIRLTLLEEEKLEILIENSGGTIEKKEVIKI